jgi:glycosyltransferase involved in cell wall biosynthesis
MKIAMTSLYLPGGSKIGVGYQVHNLANQMVRRGHEVTVFSLCEAGEAPLYELRKLKPRQRLRTFGFAWDLRAVDFSSFDVLHAHGDDWFLWGKSLPRHIHTYHGSCLAEFEHQTLIREQLRMLGLALLETASTLLCDETVAVSDNTRAYVPLVRSVIPNGVDLEQFHSQGKKSEVPTLLFVGTLHGRKRGELLLRTFRERVLPVIPNAVLWAVCEEPVEGEGVHWFGKVPTDLLGELYRSAWVFCLPSSYEGFGVPYIEAMASGTAVVATPNRGALEVLRSGTCGLVVPEERLGNALVQILRNPALRHYLESTGLRQAKKYSWDRVCSGYEMLYAGGTTRFLSPALKEEMA